MTPEEKKARRKEVRARCYAKHRDANLTYAAVYRAANAESIKEKATGKHAAYSARYREKNYTKCLEMTQAWKEANPGRRKTMQAEYLQRNLDKHRINQHNRNARKRKAGGHLSSGLAGRLLIAQRGLCACCGASLAAGYDLDHIMPVRLGGENVDSNIQLLTPRCNRRKGGKHPNDYLGEGKFLASR